MQPLIKKYQPKTLKEVIGQDKAIKELLYFINNFKNQKKKAALIYGATGIGKTCSVYAIADDNNLEVLEINASDFRNTEQINATVGIAVNQQSLFSKGKIILVDEIDGLSGRKDRGGIQAITKLIENSHYPMILTATDPWDNKFSKLRRRSVLIEFDLLDYNSIYKVLERICKNEKINYHEVTLKTLARRAGGDLRAAINDLQILVINKSLDKDSIDILSQREKEETIINALLKIFKTTDLKIAIKALDSVDEELNDVMLWLDENLPKEYEKPEDLARAYDKLSKADVFSRRIKRWQHWRFLIYINALLTAGIALSKDEKYKKFVQYKPTGRILKLWWAKQKSMKKRAIASKIAEKTHTSTKNVLKDIDYFRVIFKKNKEMAEEITGEMDLDREEVEWLKK